MPVDPVTPLPEPTSPAPVPPPLYPTPEKGEQWRHWKGNAVTILGIVLHCDTKEPYVSYQHYVPGVGLFWIRPLARWHDSEPKMNGKRRFEKIEPRKPYSAKVS